MPTIPSYVHLLHDYEQSVNGALFGRQEYLVWADASAAQGANLAGLNNAAPQGSAIQGRRLIDLAADIAAGIYTALGPGTYYAQFQLTGMVKPTIDLTATFTGGTVTTAAWSTFRDEQTQRQTFGGTGPLSTGTLQTSTLASPNGEKVGVLQIVVGAGGSITAFTRAELSGQRG